MTDVSYFNTFVNLPCRGSTGSVCIFGSRLPRLEVNDVESCLLLHHVFGSNSSFIQHDKWRVMSIDLYICSVCANVEWLHVYPRLFLGVHNMDGVCGIADRQVWRVYDGAVTWHAPHGANHWYGMTRLLGGRSPLHVPCSCPKTGHLLHTRQL